jgi:hypothetical protein
LQLFGDRMMYRADNGPSEIVISFDLACTRERCRY